MQPMIGCMDSRKVASSTGTYDHYCFLPLYVFCGEHLLIGYLRPSNIDGAKHTLPILGLLVNRMREAWPKVRIILRGDSGFCRWKTLRWCDHHDVSYIVGLAKNKRINRVAQPWRDQAEEPFEQSHEKKSFSGRFVMPQEPGTRSAMWS